MCSSRVAKLILMAGLSASLASGCASTSAGPSGNYARPMGNALVTANPTPYSDALVCLARYASQYHLTAPRIAVGRISDLTGKLDENGGKQVTQGATLMAMSALGKTGAPLVERYETDVSRLEYKLADNKLISDGPAPDGRRDYRPVYVGEVSGSDYFLTGGITELNSNIRSSNIGISASKGDGATKVGNLGGNTYVLNIAMDLRLVNTRSLDVVDIVSYQKQIIGRQIEGGLFAFFGSNVINITADTGGEEPIHLAVRSLIERAVLEMMARVYRLPGPEGCLTAGDPLRAVSVEPSVAYPAQPAGHPAQAAHPAPTKALAQAAPQSAPVSRYSGPVGAAPTAQSAAQAQGSWGAPAGYGYYPAPYGMAPVAPPVAWTQAPAAYVPAPAYQRRY